MLFNRILATATVAGVATIGLLTAPAPVASAEPAAVAATPGSTVTYTRTQTRAMDQEFTRNSAAQTTVSGGAAVACSFVPMPFKPLCAFQGAFAAWSIAMVRDNAREAARTNQCLQIDFAPNPRVDTMPLSRITNGPDCRD